MKQCVFYFFCILSLVSCKNEQEIIADHPYHGEMLDSEYLRENDRQVLVQSDTYTTPREVSSIKLLYAVKDSDTMTLDEIICVDSVQFTEAFDDIKVRKMCLEMGIQGNTYFSAKTNKYGGFEEIKVVRNTDSCLVDVEEKIMQKVLTLRALSTNYGNLEIVFCHILRID